MVNTPIASDAREFLASCRAPVDTELDRLIPRETDERVRGRFAGVFAVVCASGRAVTAGCRVRRRKRDSHRLRAGDDSHLFTDSR